MIQHRSSQNNIKRKKLVKLTNFISRIKTIIKVRKVKNIQKKVTRVYNLSVKNNFKQNTKSIKHKKMKNHKKQVKSNQNNYYPTSKKYPANQKITKFYNNNQSVKISSCPVLMVHKS